MQWNIKLSKISFSVRLLISVLMLAICLDTVDLMRQGKFHIGITFSFSLALIILIGCVFWSKWSKLISRSKFTRYAWRMIWITLGIWLISLGLFFYTLTGINHQSIDSQKPQAIIVLGSGIEGNRPSATLAKRLDTAGNLYQTFPQTPIIVTGGVGFQRSLSEAEVMSDYLQQHYYIPNQLILQENQSTSTHLNLSNSKLILKKHNISLAEPIAIVTSDFHTLRAKAIATHLGYQQPLTFAAETPLQIRYYSWVREYFAFVSGWLLKEY